MTNFEKIKQMSVEEMAEAIQNITNSEYDVKFCQNKKECDEKLDDFCFENDVFDVDLPCRNCIIEWLESEVQEDE